MSVASLIFQKLDLSKCIVEDMWVASFILQIIFYIRDNIANTDNRPAITEINRNDPSYYRFGIGLTFSLDSVSGCVGSGRVGTGRDSARCSALP